MLTQKKVGVHFAALSAILNGRRAVSRKIASRIVDNLELDPQARAELLALFPEPKSNIRPSIKAENAKCANYLQMNEKQLKLAAEWEHFAILSLLQCSEFQSSINWIANRLNISIERAAFAVDGLIEHNLLFIDVNQNIIRTKENYRTPDDVSEAHAQMVIRKAHEETLDLAKGSLHRDPIDRRDFSSVTVAVNPHKMQNAKELIRKFQDDLCDLLEDGPRTEVYRFSVQLFPLTKLSSGDLQ